MKLLLVGLGCMLMANEASAQICLGISHDGNCIGLGLTGLTDSSAAVSGVSLGLALLKGQVNGLSFGLVNDPQKTNGIALGCFVGGLRYVGDAANMTTQINGLTIGATSSAGTLNGVSVAMLNKVKKQCGILIGGLNSTNELHGLQVGILNYAGNNPRWAQWLPLLNIHR